MPLTRYGVLLQFRERRVDPGRDGQRRRLGMVANEALRMHGIGRGEDGGTRVANGVRTAVVDRFRGAQAETGMTVLGVVPREEVATERASILDRAEARRKTGSTLERPELRLRVRVVV